MRKLLVVLTAAFALLVSGCSAAKVVNLTTADVQKRVESGEQVVILDVREESEFKEGHIPGAKLIPLQTLDQRLGELKKDDAIIVVCRSGNRSAQGADLLVKSGFTKVYNMTGGMTEWKGKVEK